MIHLSNKLIYYNIYIYIYIHLEKTTRRTISYATYSILNFYEYFKVCFIALDFEYRVATIYFVNTGNSRVNIIMFRKV